MAFYYKPTFQVPLSIVFVWVYAFFLTQGGAYNFKGCIASIPPSNILTDACRRHSFTMKHCRTDASSAWKTASWVRVPYPFQWGIPTFHLWTSIIMIFVSLVASVDSVSSIYFARLHYLKQAQVLHLYIGSYVYEEKIYLKFKNKK